jgi:hypothetical protein
LVLATLAVAVFLITGDQQNGMRVSMKHPLSCNLSAIVDESRYSQCQIGTSRNKGIEIYHQPTVLPQKRVPVQECVAAVRGPADDLATGINTQSTTAGITVLSSQIRHHAVPPQKSMVNLGPWQIRLSDNLGSIIKRLGISGVSSQRTEIDKIG